MQVLLLAQTTGLMKKLGTISVDGTKIHANASRQMEEAQLEFCRGKRELLRTVCLNIVVYVIRISFYMHVNAQVCPHF